MRLNALNTKMIGQTTKVFFQSVQTAKSWLMLGVSGRQWLASLLIGMLLLPIFSLPGQAAVVISSTDANTAKFEPVNPPQYVWETAWMHLNNRIEDWSTLRRVGNEVANNIVSETSAAEKTKKDEALPKNIETANAEKEASVETKLIKKEKPQELLSKNNTSVPLPNARRSAMLSVPEPDRPMLPGDELPVLTSPSGNLGSPMGQTEPTSTTPAAATRTRERSGIGNFGFSVPIASLPGRGMDASIGLSYNSQLWTKSSITGGSNSRYTYNVDGNWVAPGFQINYGYLDGYVGGPNSQIILTDSDGTRRVLRSNGNPNPVYQADDGSFIEAYISNWGAVVTYTDGTKIEYGGPNSQTRRFPTKVTDSHGNYISIAYLTGDNSGKMSSITDTLGRQILFHYDSVSDKLIAVSVPGYEGSGTRRQTIRFYYENLTLQTTGRFDGTITAPSTVSVLKYVYFPGTRTGFRYDYSSYYGMIYKITKLEGMTVMGGSVLDQMGSVTAASFLESASTRYNYPGTDVEPPAPTLTDVPKYDKRTDDWQGRTGVAPQTIFVAPVKNVNSSGVGTVTTQVNSPDGTTSVAVAKVKPGEWDDGLTTEISMVTVGRSLPWAKTTSSWNPGEGLIGRRNPRLSKTEVTNEAGQTRATVFEYDAFNNQTLIKELDFAPAGQNGTELNKTEITYETGSGYVYSSRLVRLPTSVKKTVNNVVVSRTDYKYDESALTNRTNVAQYDLSYNPHNIASYPCNCEWVLDGQSGNYAYVCSDTCNVYDPGKNARGNVTKIISFVDTMNDSDPNASETTFKYDITGNAVEASLNCCNLKTRQYTGDNQYAYPTEVTKGTGVTLTTKAEYNFYTGLVTKTIDENNQATNYEYETETLRRKKIIYPNGASVLNEYSDKLVSDSTQLVPGFVRTTTTLEANKNAQSYSYFDARGLPIRQATAAATDGWSVSAVEYDNFGRAKKSYNPFYVSTPTGAIPSGTKFTEVTNYDALGRTTDVKLQDNTTVSTGFNGTIVTVTDQAGKQRRQIADALGRIKRVDEPDANGNLDINGVPAQPTVYEYDGNDNLSKVIQTGNGTTQERLFKYDALSRLTHERQVEASATLDDNGVKVTSGGLWTKVLKYNTRNLLTDGYDARGVNTHFTYDGINRVQTVTFSDGTPTVKYFYDQARVGFYNKGAATRVETELVTLTPPNTPTTATEFDYDKMGRAVKHRQSIGTQIYNQEYGYNLAGQMTSQTYPSGKVIATNYDANGRLSTIADQSRTYLSGLQFQGKGNSLSSMTLGNSTNQIFTLNDRLQMTNQTLSKNSEILQKYDYGYGQIDQNGDLDLTKNNGQLAKVESHIGASKQWTQKFKYDSLGRLSEAEEYKGLTTTLTYKQKFDFDRFGNLYRKASFNPTAGQENPLPFTTIEEADISKSNNKFTSNTQYDDAGNVVQDTKFRNLNFAYDANGRMIRTSNTDNTNQASSVYDASGQRVAARVYDVWKFFIYDIGGKLVAEYGGLNATDEGGVKYVLSDWQGSTRAIVSNTGFVQARQDFTTFGEEINVGVGQRTATQGFGANSNLNQKYALTERDQASGLDHTWWRKLENRAGRWTSPDPYNGSMSLGNPQSFNRYSYVKNQPTNYVDPSGLDDEIIRIYTNVSSLNSGSWLHFFLNSAANARSTTHNWGGGGLGGGGGGGGISPTHTEQNTNILGDEAKKAKERAKCEEDFLDEVIDITADNLLMQGAITAAVIITVIASGGTAAVVALIAGVAASAFVIARTIYKIWAADRDRRKCLRRIE